MNVKFVLFRGSLMAAMNKCGYYEISNFIEDDVYHVYYSKGKLLYSLKYYIKENSYVSFLINIIDIIPYPVEIRTRVGNYKDMDSEESFIKKLGLDIEKSYSLGFVSNKPYDSEYDDVIDSSKLKSDDEFSRGIRNLSKLQVLLNGRDITKEAINEVIDNLHVEIAEWLAKEGFPLYSLDELISDKILEGRQLKKAKEYIDFLYFLDNLEIEE